MFEKDIQVKFKIEDFQKFKKLLITKNVKYLGGWNEKIIRFDTEDERLQNENKFYRIKIGNENLVTLKELTNSETKFYESTNNNFQIDDVESFCYIMNEIGFTKKYIMEKYRLLWMYRDMEFYIDELPFGVFLEIKGERKNIDKVITLLKLKESDSIKLTYWEIYSQIQQGTNNQNIMFDRNHVFKISTL